MKVKGVIQGDKGSDGEVAKRLEEIIQTDQMPKVQEKSALCSCQLSEVKECGHCLNSLFQHRF